MSVNSKSFTPQTYIIQFNKGCLQNNLGYNCTLYVTCWICPGPTREGFYNRIYEVCRKGIGINSTKVCVFLFKNRKSN